MTFHTPPLHITYIGYILENRQIVFCELVQIQWSLDGDPVLYGQLTYNGLGIDVYIDFKLQSLFG